MLYVCAEEGEEPPLFSGNEGPAAILSHASLLSERPNRRRGGRLAPIRALRPRPLPPPSRGSRDRSCRRKSISDSIIRAEVRRASLSLSLSAAREEDHAYLRG